MSEQLPPTRWHLGIEIAVNGAGEFLVCSECGEYVVREQPRTWTYPWGPAPEVSHLLDREPLCPIISTADGVSGYVPAEPVTRREFDDANGCPCDGAYVCGCACSSCTCPIDQVERADELATEDDEGVIPRG